MDPIWIVALTIINGAFTLGAWWLLVETLRATNRALEAEKRIHKYVTATKAAKDKGD